jgi:hypothetical protein
MRPLLPIAPALLSLCLTATLSAQETTSAAPAAPPAPPIVHLAVGISNVRGAILYSGLSLDVRIKGKPASFPLLSLYTEDASFVAFSYAADSPFRPNVLDSFHGTGVAVVWNLPLKTQMGMGIGKYAASSASYTFLDTIPAIHAKGTGGKVFIRFITSKSNFTEISHIVPASNRFAVTQIGFGVQF